LVFLHGRTVREVSACYFVSASRSA
jgi:hypothetical protein